MAKRCACELVKRRCSFVVIESTNQSGSRIAARIFTSLFMESTASLFIPLLMGVSISDQIMLAYEFN